MYCPAFIYKTEECNKNFPSGLSSPLCFMQMRVGWSVKNTKGLPCTPDYPRKNPEHHKTGQPRRSDLKQYNQLQKTKSAVTTPPKKGPNLELRRYSMFSFMFIQFFSEISNPTVNLSYL
jgi:hypothetical protein